VQPEMWIMMDIDICSKHGVVSWNGREENARGLPENRLR